MRAWIRRNKIYFLSVILISSIVLLFMGINTHSFVMCEHSIEFFFQKEAGEVNSFFVGGVLLTTLFSYSGVAFAFISGVIASRGLSIRIVLKYWHRSEPWKLKFLLAFFILSGLIILQQSFWAPYYYNLTAICLLFLLGTSAVTVLIYKLISFDSVHGFSVLAAQNLSQSLQDNNRTQYKELFSDLEVSGLAEEKIDAVIFHHLLQQSNAEPQPLIKLANEYINRQPKKQIQLDLLKEFLYRLQKRFQSLEAETILMSVQILIRQHALDLKNGGEDYLILLNIRELFFWHIAAILEKEKHEGIEADSIDRNQLTVKAAGLWLSVIKEAGLYLVSLAENQMLPVKRKDLSVLLSDYILLGDFSWIVNSRDAAQSIVQTSLYYIRFVCYKIIYEFLKENLAAEQVVPAGKVLRAKGLYSISESLLPQYFMEDLKTEGAVVQAVRDDMLFLVACFIAGFSVFEQLEKEGREPLNDPGLIRSLQDELQKVKENYGNVLQMYPGDFGNWCEMQVRSFDEKFLQIETKEKEDIKMAEVDPERLAFIQNEFEEVLEKEWPEPLTNFTSPVEKSFRQVFEIPKLWLLRLDNNQKDSATPILNRNLQSALLGRAISSFAIKKRLTVSNKETVQSLLPDGDYIVFADRSNIATLKMIFPTLSFSAPPPFDQVQKGMSHSFTVKLVDGLSKIRIVKAVVEEPLKIPVKFHEAVVGPDGNMAAERVNLVFELKVQIDSSVKMWEVEYL